VDDKRNLIFAVLLTGLILFGWPYVASYFFPTPAPVTSSATTAASPAGAATSDVPVIGGPCTNTGHSAEQRAAVNRPNLGGNPKVEGLGQS